MKDSRTKNTTRNIKAGLINRLAAMIFMFANRTVVLYTLGDEYTGLGSLFTSILGVLNLAELGFNTAVVYSLYQPMANQDKQKICELLTLLRKIYCYIGTVVLVIGLAIMPFIDNFIKGTYPNEINIYVLYVICLSNTVISYFMFAYREALLLADQRRDISQIIRTITLVLQNTAQIAIIVIWKDYYIYMIISIICTIFTNISLAYQTKKIYPEYNCIKTQVIKIPNDIKKQVGGLFINRVCDMTRNSLDSIIISVFLGLTAVTVYGNYFYIYDAIYGIMLVIGNSMSASIGNSIATETVDKNYNQLIKFTFMYSWIQGFCTVCLVCLYQPFMQLWAGTELMLSTGDMILFCIYFYIINMNNIRNQFISGTGLWWKLRKTYIAETLGNLCLNIVLGKLFGITGVLLATIITIFLSNFLWRTNILFKNYFKGKNLKKYLLDYFIYASVTLVAAIICYNLCDMLIWQSGILCIIVRAIICIIVTNIIFLCFYFKTGNFREAKIFALKTIKSL